MSSGAWCANRLRYTDSASSTAAAVRWFRHGTRAGRGGRSRPYSTRAPGAGRGEMPGLELAEERGDGAGGEAGDGVDRRSQRPSCPRPGIDDSPDERISARSGMTRPERAPVSRSIRRSRSRKTSRARSTRPSARSTPTATSTEAAGATCSTTPRRPRARCCGTPSTARATPPACRWRAT